MPAPIQTYLVLLPLLTMAADELTPADLPQVAPAGQPAIIIRQEADSDVVATKQQGERGKLLALGDFIPFAMIPMLPPPLPLECIRSYSGLRRIHLELPVAPPGR